jgi:alpha-galactosidase
MIGNDVRTLDAPTREILLNREAIALDQDPLGRQGYFVGYDFPPNTEIWKKPLAGGELGVGLFNRHWQRTRIVAHWSDLEIRGAYKVRDLWAHEDRGVYDQEFSAEVAPHGCALLRLTPV